jgi:hypothetical protein
VSVIPRLESLFKEWCFEIFFTLLTAYVKVSSSAIFAQGNPIGKYIWRTYLPTALSVGNIVPKPDPLVVGEGLRSVQHALDQQKKGVSAAKVVVANIQSDGSSKETVLRA